MRHVIIAAIILAALSASGLAGAQTVNKPGAAPKSGIVSPRDAASGLPTGVRSPRDSASGQATGIVSPRDSASGLPTGKR